VSFKRKIAWGRYFIRVFLSYDAWNEIFSRLLIGYREIRGSLYSARIYRARRKHMNKMAPWNEWTKRREEGTVERNMTRFFRLRDGIGIAENCRGRPGCDIAITVASADRPTPTTRARRRWGREGAAPVRLLVVFPRSAIRSDGQCWLRWRKSDIRDRSRQTGENGKELDKN